MTADVKRLCLLGAESTGKTTLAAALAERFAAPRTVWILPKGRNAKSELEAARSSWQGDFRLEPSLTDADALIVVASRVRRKPGGRRP